MKNIMKKALRGLWVSMAMLVMANANAAISLDILPTSGTVFAAGTQVGSESSALPIKLTATGTNDVTFAAIGIDSLNFTLQLGDCAATMVSGVLAAGDSCTLQVSFTPKAAGTRSAELVVLSDAATVSISGLPAVKTVAGQSAVYLQGTAAKSNQNVSFGAAPTLVVNGTGNVSASATSGLAVSYSTTTPGVCTINGSTVTVVSAGTCTIAANQAGNSTYNAAPPATQNITVNKINQTVSFTSAPASLAVGATGTVSATGGGSGNSVIFTSTNNNICTISNGNTVTGVSAGTCTIAANQAGNAAYNAATQVTQNIAVGTVSKIAQTINWGAAPAITAGGTGTVTASATSGLAVTLLSATPGVCTVSGSTVSGVTAGSCTITANQAGNGTYDPAPQATQIFTIGAASGAGTGNDLCAQYGITNNIVLPRAGNTSKFLYTAPNKGYSFSFTTGANGTLGKANTNYSNSYQYVTLSKNKCDYNVALETKCAKQGTPPPLVYYRVGGTSAYECVLEPNTTYYINVRNARRDATTKVLSETCTTGSCPFMLF